MENQISDLCSLASCGCFYHTEEGILCPHDKQLAIKQGKVCKADTDGMYYLKKDLIRKVNPTDEDPGVLVPILGAIPVWG